MSAKKITSNFNVNSYVSTNSECQCCSYLRSEVCYLVNELKSMTEIISILQEEAKYDRTVKHDQRTYSDCIKKPTTIYSQRNNCSNRGNQLKLADSLRLVKQARVENLTEETILVKQTSQMASNIYNPWSTAHSNKTHGYQSVRPPAREPSIYGTWENSTTYQYSVPIANRYTALSNCLEHQPTCEMISPSNDKYSPRFMKAKKITDFHF